MKGVQQSIQHQTSNMRIFAAIAAVVLCCAIESKGDATPAKSTIYDSDTNHLWNRLNETLFERTAQDGRKYGLDELDILYWYRTKHLLEGPSHEQALAILDEFINTHGEKLIRNPLKRALLQRDLWELFDWSALSWPGAPYAKERKELQNRLVVVMHRLALTTNEIASLTDNYSMQAETEKLPDLPQGLFQTNGDWVNLAPDMNGQGEIALTHDHSADGHSTFLVMVHLPGGRQAALSYLNQLRSFEHFWVYRTNTDVFATTNSPTEVLTLNTNLTEFPANTEWAIVRRMFVIDADGNIQPTRMVESIQLRRYLAIARPSMVMVTNNNGGVSAQWIPPQNFYEFQMDPRRNGGLREVAKDEKDFVFVHFLSQGGDPLEWRSDDSQVPDSSTIKRTVLKQCQTCHAAEGFIL